MWQVGRTPLIGTSRPPNGELSHVAPVFRDCVRVQSVSGHSTAISSGWRPTIVMGAGLAALMCLTTWAVASVSPWMTPAYLVLMVLIFVAPRNQRQLLVLLKRCADPVGNHQRDGSCTPDTGDVGAVVTVRNTDQSVGTPAVHELTVDPASSSAEPVGGGAVRHARGRSRPRKTSKPVAAVAAVAPSVAWIRVGPGKFVRADGNSSAIAQVEPHAQPDPCVAGTDPVADSSVPALPATAEIAEAAAETSKCDPLHSTESNPDDVAVSNEVLGSPIEEHGIAPSALDQADISSAPADSRNDAVANTLITPAFEIDPVLSLTEKAPDCDLGSERPRLHQKRPGANPRRVLRRFTGAMPAARRACWQQSVGTVFNSRFSVRFPVRSSYRRRPFVGRASWRSSPRRRALRPRSPPYASFRE